MKHYLGFCFVLVTLAAIVIFTVRSCASAADQTVAHVRDAFAQVFNLQPQVTVNERVVLTQTAPIAELAVASKQELVTLGSTQHFEVLSYQVPLTEKTLKVEATYLIKAGFDLHKPFHVTIDPATQHIVASLPHATILSVEQIGGVTYHDEDAALNRITDSDREKLLDDLNALAHTQAEQSSLKSDAEKQVASRLQELIKHNGESIDAVWNDDNSPPPKRP